MPGRSAARAKIACAVLAVALMVLAVDPAQAVPEDRERLVVALFVNGVNGEELIVLREDERFWMPLETLAPLIRLRVGPDGILDSPIGDAQPPEGSLLEHQGTDYISDQQLEDWLRIRTRFVPSSYALMLEVPWDVDVAERPADRPDARVPDVRAPAGSLSFVRLRGSHVADEDGGNAQSEATLDLGGRAGPGTWLIGARARTGRPAFADRYFWTIDGDHVSARIGTGFARVNPLVDNLEFTGLQGAWSADGIRPYRDFAGDLNFDSFLAEDTSMQRTILRTDGPPGGVAELRVDDRPVARVRIDLDGRYEFRDIDAGAGGYQRVTVFVYERSTLEPPVDEFDLSRQAIREIVPGGETLVRAVAGRAGNPLDDTGRIDRDDNAVGFLVARHGLTDRMTLQSIVQREREGATTAVAGFRASVGRRWGVAADLSDRDGARGAFVQVERDDPAWTVRLRGQFEEHDYNDDSAREDDLLDVRLRSFKALDPGLRVGLVGRAFEDGRGREERFVKPGAYWNPTARLFLSAVPNLDGDYRVQGTWRHSYRHRWTLRAEQADTYSVVHDFRPAGFLSLQNGVEYVDDRDDAQLFSQVNWSPGRSIRNLIQAGISFDGNTTGARLSWRKRWQPGIETDLSWDAGFRRPTGGLFELENRVLFTLRMDFAAIGGGLRPADNRRLNSTRGAIAGRIVTPSGRALDVDDVQLRINDRRPLQEQIGGGFFVGDLEPGIYAVRLDEANLPLEYTPVRRALNVEVASSTVTGFDFEVEARYSVAGRVTQRADSTGIPGLQVVALDPSGTVVGQGRSDRFGYYRIGSLEPGEYRVRLADDLEARRATELTVRIVDDHVFEVDLELRPRESPP
jgi:hypothetical protein